MATADETTQETLSPIPPAARCVNYADCGNETPGGEDAGNMMCDACLDAARAGGTGHDLATPDEDDA